MTDLCLKVVRHSLRLASRTARLWLANIVEDQVDLGAQNVRREAVLKVFSSCWRTQVEGASLCREATCGLRSL